MGVFSYLNESAGPKL